MPNVTNLDQESVMNNRTMMMGNGGGFLWDLENNLQFINEIKIEEDAKKLCSWEESYGGIVIDEKSNENSGDFMIGNYPLTSLSAEDFCGTNLDHVFSSTISQL